MASTSSTSNEPCGICLDSYNASTRKQVTCIGCKYAACQKCVQTYLLGSTQDPHCMNCREMWDKDFMADAFTKKFINDEYKKHRENVLLEREKSMLVATMPQVENEKRLRVLNAKLKALKEKQIELKKLLAETKHNINIVSSDIWDIKYPERMHRRGGAREQPEQPKYIRGCPAPNCRGFLNTDWTCEVCLVHVCSDCHEIKKKPKEDEQVEHTCDPNNVETAKAIMKETRPCPVCAARIFKIDGCDQMWCTSCHTAFSWRTGAIEQNMIHNPHYFEYMRRNGGGNMPRADGDIQCGGFPTANTMMRVFKRLNAPDKTDKLFYILRELLHIHAVVLPSFQIYNARDQNVDLRVLYILGEVEEADWKRKLQIREKHRVKCRDMRMILDTLIAVCVDIFQRMVNMTNVQEVDSFKTELRTICEHINDCFVRHANKYSAVTYFLNPESFNLQSLSKKKHQED